MSLNLILGYTGLFSLGHAAFFGVGGYTAGILIVRYGINSFWLVAPAGIFLAAIIAGVFGIVALRVTGLYFLFVTLALGQLVYSVAWKWKEVTGGTHGLIGIPPPDLGIPWLTWNTTNFYYFILISFVICSFLLYRIVNSPFGYALQGVRENELRMRNLGYNTWAYKYIAFVIAGLFAGVAGVLFGYHNRLMSIAQVGVSASGLVMLMVIIGSTSIFLGPVIGAATIMVLESFISLYAPERWPLILGIIFVLTVTFLRGGIGIYLSGLWNRVRDIYGSTKG